MILRRLLAVAVLSASVLAAEIDAASVEAAGTFAADPVCLAGRTAANLDSMFASEPGGVIGADYQRAFTMPDGRVLWTFQDAAVRVGDEILIVHNIAVLQDATCFTVMYGGSRNSPRPMFFADLTVQFARWFWPMDATVMPDGRIAVFTAEMEERSDSYLVTTVPLGTWVAIFDPASNRVVDERRPADSSADLYGWSVTSDDGWTYLYAQCYRQFGFDTYVFTAAFDRSCSTEVTVARIPRGQVFVAPEYWDGGAWQSDPARAAPIIDQRGRRINANQFEWTGAGFVSVNKEGDWWGDTIYLSRSLHPAGPFEMYDTVTAPLKCGASVCNSFFASFVPAAAAKRGLGRFVVSISHNRWDGVTTSIYRPSYFDVAAPVHLPAMSTIERYVGESDTAVVLNVGVVGPAAPGFLTVYPCDQGLPNASNVNHVNEPVVSNLVVARADSSGRVCVYSLAATDIIIDQTGTFDRGAGFVPVARPTRLADTRSGLGVAQARVPAGGVLAVPIPDGADRSSVLNVIAVDPSAPGFLTVFDCGEPQPATSNVNYVGEPVVSNLVIASVGASGSVCISSLSETDVVVDLAGSFARGSAGFVPLDAPTRLLDTREMGEVGRLGDGATVAVRVPDAAAVVLNVVSDSPDGPGFLTVYPCDIDRPDTSNINQVSVPVVSNIVISRPSADDRVCIYSLRSTDIVVDLFGTLPAGSGFSPLDVPRRIVDTRDGTGIAGQLGNR